MTKRILLSIGCFVFVASMTAAQTERKVGAPTRLDWEFASRSFGPKEAKLPAGYDSTKQKYQLFVPKSYKKDKPAGLVLFISPGEGPMGLKNWQGVCEKEGMLFASPFAAGNSVALGQRTRIILDVLDDVRRNYAIDPDLTYLTGFSGGGRMACAIGFALPEYFGGIMPVCGINTPNAAAYLRHRAADRLSVALITGEKDMNRSEAENGLGPWLKEIGIREKVWVVPQMGHAIPQAPVIAEAHAWLAEDLKRRRDDAKANPQLVVKHDDTPNAAQQAKRLTDAALETLEKPERTFRAVVMFQGVTQRWPKSAGAIQATKALKGILDSEPRLKLIEAQGAIDEVKSMSAQARAFERLGSIPKAIEAWEFLARNYEGGVIAENALENIKRLRAKGK